MADPKAPRMVNWLAVQWVPYWERKKAAKKARGLVLLRVENWASYWADQMAGRRESSKAETKAGC